ncbi:hypothetical protein C7M61_000842 [Candidozyma pseudohaemuli]|uniref:Thiaminase-2/PQQC domain-containing protein n=1 Tax=Candidozyma pseudohaemuli TaxID=418784 RepID=A0A2P7YYW8_9ASCO|nr:hypothetical protein C7M61_000842 [[Candida] pseudohaemulonii]PSK41168.1 hypothetical protein C7M61_000842 [[Candida] pseudohaemulonii]
MTFIDQLLEKHHDKFHKLITCALTNELCKGTLPDYKLFTYLVQDLKFFQLGLNLFGNALVYCDKPESAIVLGKQIGFISNSENTYFFKCLDQLRAESKDEIEANAKSMLKDDPPTLPAVQKYLDILDYLTFKLRLYPEIITFMYVMEKVYQGWAEYHLERTPEIKNLAYKHNEWVVLHSGPEFGAWCDFLADEVNRVGVDEESKKKCSEFFEKTLDLEIEFFESCYDYHD